MTLLLHLRIVGVMMLVLVIINLLVPGHFRWRQELARLSLFTRQVFQVHCAFILLTLALFAALLLLYTNELLEPTPLARAILLGMTMFWLTRMLVQWFFYSPAIWRGHRGYTAVHVAFSMLWIYFTATFATAFYLSVAR